MRRWFLLLLLIPVLAVAGGQVWNEACAKPPATILPGIVVEPSVRATPAARRPLPPVPPSGYITVNR